jgi:hypothetical protein
MPLQAVGAESAAPVIHQGADMEEAVPKAKALGCRSETGQRRQERHKLAIFFGCRAEPRRRSHLFDSVAP